MTQSEQIGLGDGLAGWVCGAGETIVWLHGYTMNSSLWGEIWSLLPGFRHVGIDLPGHGASRPMRADESLDATARSVLDACRSLGATRIVALSLGTLIGLQVAMTSPGDIAYLALAAPALGGMPVDPAAQQRNLELLRQFRATGPGRRLTELWMRSPPDIFKGAARLPDLHRQIREVIETHPWGELISGGLRNWAECVQPASCLSRISARTLIIIGEEDMPSFRRNAHSLAQHIPGAERHYLSGVGHLPLLEAPRLCAPLLQSHFRGHHTRSVAINSDKDGAGRRAKG